MFSCALAHPPAYFCACAGPNRHDVSIDMGDFGRIYLHPAGVPCLYPEIPEDSYACSGAYGQNSVEFRCCVAANCRTTAASSAASAPQADNSVKEGGSNHCS